MPSLLYRSLFLLLSGIALIALGVQGLYLFTLADWFTDPGPYPYQSWQGYGKTDFTGLVFFTFCSTIGITLFVVGLQAISTTLIAHSYGGFVASVLPTSVLVVGLLTIAVISCFWGHETLRCGVVDCTVDTVDPEIPNGRPEAIWGWKADLGITALIASLSLAVARSAIVVISYFGLGGVTNTRITLNPTIYYWACAIIVPILSAFYFYLGATIPNSWEYHSAPRLAAYLAQMLFEESNCPDNGSYCPELTGAWFTTHQWKFSSAVILKIFPGNVMFYVYLLLVGTLGVVAHQIQWSRKFLQRRIVPPCLVRFNLPFTKYPLRITVGDVIISLLTTTMLVLFLLYWAQSHNFNGNWSPTTGNLITPSERWARALGQFAVVLLSLLLFPASRTSIFHHPFGTHWEAFLWTHRVLGTLMLLATIGHMVAWYVRFNEVGLFPSDIMKVPMTLPSTIDNWTVPLISLTSWFLLLAVGIGALPPIRRRFFEAFYYLHLIAAYSTIPAVLWHATAGWEYMLPGLTIWFVDRVIRFFRSGAPATVIDITVFTNAGEKGASYNDPETDGRDVLEIRFRPAVGMTVHPGQYVFLNVPQISVLEWHPYTVSTTGTSSDYLTVHMKGMGCGTWSDRVIQHCRTIQQVPTGLANSSTQFDELNKLIQLNVDGPYGSPIYYNDYDQVLLIAGGIGITPCASILTGLRAAQYRLNNAIGSTRDESIGDLNRNSYTSPNAPLLSGNGSRCKVRRVVLRWSVRHMAEVDALSSALACSEADLPMNGGGHRSRQSDSFEQRCTIHATRGLFLDPPAGFDVQQGRPNYKVLLREELLTGDYMPHNTLVFVCGPTAMMDDAVNAATALGCHVHNEVFEL